MSEVDSVHLLVAYLRSQGFDTKEYPLDIDEFTAISAKGFYLYDLHSLGPHGSFQHVGTYGVNAETGDIWDTDLCRRLDTSPIASLEKLVREKIGLSKSDSERLGKIKPPCFN